MENFTPVFTNENEKSAFTLTLILGIFLGFVPFLIAAIAYKNMFNENNYEIIKALCNFNICLTILGFGVSIIPIVQLLAILLGPAFFIWNLILIATTLRAANENKPVQLPVFIKIF